MNLTTHLQLHRIQNEILDKFWKYIQGMLLLLVIQIPSSFFQVLLKYNKAPKAPAVTMLACPEGYEPLDSLSANNGLSLSITSFNIVFTGMIMIIHMKISNAVILPSLLPNRNKTAIANDQKYSRP